MYGIPVGESKAGSSRVLRMRVSTRSDRFPRSILYRNYSSGSSRSVRSTRPGTPAAAYGDPVHGALIGERGRRLRQAGARLAARFREDNFGRRLEFLTLEKGWSGGATLRALSGNYLDADLEWPGGSPNRFVEAVATGSGRTGRVQARALREIAIGCPARAPGGPPAGPGRPAASAPTFRLPVVAG